jgi:hypothetical protein
MVRDRYPNDANYAAKDGSTDGFRRCSRRARHAHPFDTKSALCTQHFIETRKALADREAVPA